MDASIVETTKQDALFSYQGSPSFQPLSVRWAELDLVAHSEFRMNVRRLSEFAGFQETLEVLPKGIQKVYLKSDTAAYQKELLIYCAEGPE